MCSIEHSLGLMRSLVQYVQDSGSLSDTSATTEAYKVTLASILRKSFAELADSLSPTASSDGPQGALVLYAPLLVRSGASENDVNYPRQVLTGLTVEVAHDLCFDPALAAALHMISTCNATPTTPATPQTTSCIAARTGSALGGARARVLSAYDAPDAELLSRIRSSLLLWREACRTKPCWDGDSIVDAERLEDVLGVAVPCGVLPPSFVKLFVHLMRMLRANKDGDGDRAPLFVRLMAHMLACSLQSQGHPVMQMESNRRWANVVFANEDVHRLVSSTCVEWLVLQVRHFDMAALAQAGTDASLYYVCDGARDSSHALLRGLVGIFERAFPSPCLRTILDTHYFETLIVEWHMRSCFREDSCVSKYIYGRAHWCWHLFGQVDNPLDHRPRLALSKTTVVNPHLRASHLCRRDFQDEVRACTLDVATQFMRNSTVYGTDLAPTAESLDLWTSVFYYGRRSSCLVPEIAAKSTRVGYVLFFGCSCGEVVTDADREQCTTRASAQVAERITREKDEYELMQQCTAMHRDLEPLRKSLDAHLEAMPSRIPPEACDTFDKLQRCIRGLLADTSLRREWERMQRKHDIHATLQRIGDMSTRFLSESNHKLMRSCTALHAFLYPLIRDMEHVLEAVADTDKYAPATSARRVVLPSSSNAANSTTTAGPQCAAQEQAETHPNRLAVSPRRGPSSPRGRDVTTGDVAVDAPVCAEREPDVEDSPTESHSCDASLGLACAADDVDDTLQEQPQSGEEASECDDEQDGALYAIEEVAPGDDCDDCGAGRDEFAQESELSDELYWQEEEEELGSGGGAAAISVSNRDGMTRKRARATDAALHAHKRPLTARATLIKRDALVYDMLAILGAGYIRTTTLPETRRPMVPTYPAGRYVLYRMTKGQRQRVKFMSRYSAVHFINTYRRLVLGGAPASAYRIPVVQTNEKRYCLALPIVGKWRYATAFVMWLVHVCTVSLEEARVHIRSLLNTRDWFNTEKALFSIDGEGNITLCEKELGPTRHLNIQCSDLGPMIAMMKRESDVARQAAGIGGLEPWHETTLRMLADVRSEIEHLISSPHLAHERASCHAVRVFVGIVSLL